MNVPDVLLQCLAPPGLQQSESERGRSHLGSSSTLAQFTDEWPTPIFPPHLQLLIENGRHMAACMRSSSPTVSAWPPLLPAPAGAAPTGAVRTRAARHTAAAVTPSFLGSREVPT